MEPNKCESCGDISPMNFIIATVNQVENVPGYICDNCGHFHEVSEMPLEQDCE